MNFLLHNNIFHFIILMGLFSYLIGVIFLPLLVQDVLRDAIPDKYTFAIWRAQYIPIINFILFISIFIIFLWLTIWFFILKAIWGKIYVEQYDKYYKKIYVPEKYKIKREKKDDN